MKLQIDYENLEKSKKENENKLAEYTVKVGQFAQMEIEFQDKEKKLQSYMNTNESMKNDISKLEKKDKENKIKIEDLEKKYKELKKNKKGGAGFDIEKLKMIAGGDGEGISGVGIINSLFLLQREKKAYKNKFMKEKLSKLMEDKDSYVNQYMRKENKLLKIDNDKEVYKNIKNKEINLNKNCGKIRQKLCLPKVLDLSQQNYDYEKEKQNQENEIEKTRTECLKDTDNILFSMFGDNSDNKTIKQMVNFDINKTLNSFSDKKYLVGKLQFNEGNKNQGGDVYSSKQTLGVPIVISEDSIKKLNNTVIH